MLFDLYDRLERGLRTFEAGVESLRAKGAGGWRDRLLRGGRRIEEIIDATQSLGEGYQLTASRLEGALQQWGIERIGQAGEMFDPVLMSVVEVVESADEPAGTVLEVYRGGYMMGDQVLATAQVKVAR